MTARVHPFPSRTRKLSSFVPKILDWRRSGKIGRRLHSSLAQSVEHLTVNQGVAGPSPAGGVELHSYLWSFFIVWNDYHIFLFFVNLTGFILI